jgi:hypothetical protein
MIGLAVGLLAGLNVLVSAIPTPGTIVGIAEDWTHHHVVFSNPGTASDALAQGRFEQWYKMVNDPRYVMQQMRRNGMARAMMSAPDFAARMALLHPPTDFPDRDWKRRKKSEGTLTKDWNVDIGSTAASQTGTVSGTLLTTANQTVVITNGASNLTLTATPAYATASGTFSAEPTSGGTLTITNGTSSIVLSALTTGATNVCTASGNPRTGSFTRNGTVNTDATRLVTLITSGNCGSYVGVTATAPGAGEVTITATTAGTGGNSISVQASASFDIAAWTTATDLTGGLVGSQGGLDFETSSTASTEASNIASAINVSGNGSSVGVSATANSPASGDVTITATTLGTGGNSITVASTTNFTITSPLAGGGTGGTVGSGNFPAKFSFNSAPSCSDFAVFNTSLAGSSTAATVMAVTNLYSSCNSGTPTIAWAYNTTTNDTVNTSVVFNLQGNQIAFISTDGTHAYLNVLQFASGQGTAFNTPKDLTTTATNSGSAYHTCTQTAGNTCLLRLEFANDDNDTTSSPYYDYPDDLLWVGDAAGNVHEFTGVFNGSVAEAGSPWPVSVGATTALTSPVYYGGYVYVANNYVASLSTAGARMYAITVSSGAVAESAQLTSTATANVGITDGALLDVANNYLYVAVAYDVQTGANHPSSGIIRITTPGLGTVSEVWFPTGTATVPAFTGTFDNTHYVSGGTTGYVSTCNISGGILYFNPISLAGFVSGSKTEYSGVTGDVYEEVATAAVTCSPQTEILSSNGDDYMFMSVASHADQAGGNSGCSTGTADACLYSFQIGTSSGYTWTTAAAPGYGFQIPQNTATTSSSTSGIIVDNSSASPGSNIYFTTNATTNGTPCSNGDGCAIQVTQAAP